MNDIAKLGFDVDSRPLGTATEKLTRFGATGASVAAQTQTATASINGGFRRAAAGMLAFVGVQQTLSRALGASETYTGITNSLKAMGESSESATAILAQVAEVARETRSPLDATAKLYQRVSVAGKDLGASQSDVLKFTKNVGLALGQSGTSAQEASGALLQLSQAMAGGVVRAEEFNSILEGAFPIAQAAANAIDGAAGSVGKLRNMVVNGEVSSREFFEAILSQSEALEASFAQTVPTIGQAFQVLSDQVTLYVGSADAAMGVSSALAQALLLIGDNLDRVAFWGGTAAAVFAARYVGSMVASRLATHGLVGALYALKAALISTGIGAAVVIAGELALQFHRLVKATGSFAGAVSAAKDIAIESFDRIKMGASAVGHGLNAIWQTMAYQFNTAIASMAVSASDFFASLSGGLAAVPGMGGVATMMGNVSTAAIKAAAGVQDVGNEAYKAAEAADKMAHEMAKAAVNPLASMQVLRDEVEKSKAAMDEIAAGVGSVPALSVDSGGASGGSGGGGGGASAVNEAHEERLREAQRLFEETRTAAEQYAKEIADLNELYGMGYLDQETYARATKMIEENFAGAAEQAGALQYIGQQAGDTLINSLMGAKDAGEQLKETLARVLLQAALLGQGPLAGLFGGGGGLLGGLFGMGGGNSGGGGGQSGGGGIGGLLGGLLGGLGGGGGGGSQRMPAPPSYARAPSAPAYQQQQRQEPVVVQVELRDDMLDARIDNRSARVSEQMTRKGIQEYDRNVAPNTVKRVQNSPRRIG